VTQAVGRRQVGLALRHRQGEHPVTDVGLHLGVVKAQAEPKPQAIVALRSLEVQGLPVHAHKTDLVRGDDQVRPVRLDFHARGAHTGDVDDNAYGVRELTAIVARLAKGAFGRLLRIEMTTG